MSKKFYLTTPLYYVNGVPHVGHVYTTVIAEAIARYKRMCGLEVCALTGTDEHGLKIERAAADRGVRPQELTTQFANEFKNAWERLDLKFDEFIRTTEDRHREAVTSLYEKIRANDFIYLGEYTGQYCVNCEAYVPEGETTCPDCGRDTEFVTEESYFFKLSAFQEKLLTFYHDNPDFVVPKTRMNEIVSFVKGGLKDLSISRTSFRWGIPLPSDEDHIFYVWFDALTGYLSGIGFGSDEANFRQYWPADVQLIGKDILRFHAVYWPAFLMASGLEPPRHILVNGWWTVDGAKMSKSANNFVTAEELSQKLPPDYIKYFLLREIPIGGDGDFSYQAVVNRVNADLANDIGNLTNRTLKMIESYFSGKIPEMTETSGRDKELIRFSRETVKLYRENFDNFQINRAFDNVWELISVANKYLVANEPWALAQKPAERDRLGSILYCAAETVRIIAILLGPIVPHGAADILRQLGIRGSLETHLISSLNWGGLTPGTESGEISAVYPRLDPDEFLQGAEKPVQAAKDPAESRQTTSVSESNNLISIQDFTRVEMKVGRIISADRIPKSSKLLKIQVDLGSEVRQVVAGIGSVYEPEELADRKVVVVTNLEPVKLMGVESNGMLVAASDEGKPVLATFTEEVGLGVRLK